MTSLSHIQFMLSSANATSALSHDCLLPLETSLMEDIRRIFTYKLPDAPSNQGATTEQELCAWPSTLLLQDAGMSVSVAAVCCRTHYLVIAHV